MDCTQVLERDELDDSVAYKYKVKVAELKVNDNLYPIFSGSNRIGRDPEFCSVVFNNMTLSKEHAVIEVEDRFSHLIYDLGSKNKTKVGKTILKPHIRYQLVDKSQILLGDLLAEYLVVSEEQENKPFAVIQESDDEIIPDTPVQLKSRESKESSSSREESPTIFQMESQRQLGYDEPCMEIVQEPGMPEGNLAEYPHPGENENENKEFSATDALNTSVAIATVSTEVNVDESDIKETTEEANHASDGDETDPEDVFFAMTQKRDESLLESSERERTSDLKETVEDGQSEVKVQEGNDRSTVCGAAEESGNHTSQQNANKQAELQDSSIEADDNVSSAVTRIVDPKVKKVQEQCEESNKFCDEESSKENESYQKETSSSNFVETNGKDNTASSAVIKELNEENESKHFFKQPLTTDTEQTMAEKTAQVILPVDEEMTGERIETVDLSPDLESESDSFFNASTQVLQPENHETPLSVAAQEQETNGSPGRNESCNNTGGNEGIGGPESNSEIICDAPIEVIDLDDEEESSSGVQQEVREQVPCVLVRKSNTTENVEDSDSTTDDESSFFNAPTQVVHIENDHTDSKSPSGTEPGKPTCSSVSLDGIKVRGKDGQEETLEADDIVKEADDFIFTAPIKVLPVGKKGTNVSSEENTIELNVEHQQLTGSVTEESSENDSIFEAATQIMHNENSHMESLKSAATEMQPESKETDQEQRGIISNSETNKDDSIYEAETQVILLESDASVTFKTSTPAKKKRVMFADVNDELQSIKREASSEEPLQEEDTTSKSENESIFDAPTQVLDPGYKGSSSSKEPSGELKALKVVVLTEEKEKQISDHGNTSNQQGSSSEAKLSKSPQIHQLDDSDDDSDDSIFSAPTQVISKLSPKHDSTSSRASTSGKLSSTILDSKVDPEPALQIVENIENKTSSEQDSCDESNVAYRKEDEDVLSDSFFEASTQLYTSTALPEAIESRESTSGKVSSTILDTKVVPEPALQIVENNEVKTSSGPNSCDESLVGNRKEDEDVLNDSFFEAPTQLYASTTLSEAIDSSTDDKANKSLSRSSSYSSIHEAPTQCIDDLAEMLDSENAKGNAERSGPPVAIQEKERDIVEGRTVEGPLQEHDTTSLANESIDLILPSSQELREVGQEYYGYASDDERPSTSNNTSSPVIQKRTRSIPAKKAILKARGLESEKPNVASGSRGTGSMSVKSLSGSDTKEQPDIKSKKQVKLLKERNDEKKTAGKKKATTVKESDKVKKITDYLKSNNTRDKSAESECKNEENKASDESETGRPSRQRKPTWKARESSQDMLLGAMQKAKKGEIKEHSKVSPGSSKQNKKQGFSPSNEVHSAKEDQNRKENSKLPSKMITEPCVNSESKLEDNVKEKETENVSLSLGKWRNIHVHSLPPPQSEGEKTTIKKGKKSKRSQKEVNKLKTPELKTLSSPESNTESSSPSDKMKQRSVDSNSPKKRGRINLLLPNSSEEVKNAVDESNKGSDVPASNVEAKVGKGTRSRKKPSNSMTNDQKQDVSPLQESLEIKEVDKNKRGRRPKRSIIISDVIASVSKSVTKPACGKIQQENKTCIDSDRQRNKNVPSSSIEDESEGVGKRPRRTTGACSASSADVEVKPVKRPSPSSDKQLESRVQFNDDKEKTVHASRRGRSNQPATNSMISDVEIILEKTREYSSEKQQENNISPPDQLDVRKKGRPKRSAASCTSSVRLELKPVVRNKRTQDSDICDTPTKERKISDDSEQDKNVVTGQGGRAKRDANKAFGLDKESNAIVGKLEVQRLQESDICDTPRKQRRTGVSSLESGDVENVETNRRGRSKRSATQSVSSERETRASSLESDDVEILDTSKRGRSKRSVVSRVPLEKETGASSLEGNVIEIMETKRGSRSKKYVASSIPLKRETGASLESGEVEILETNKRSRSKKSAFTTVPLASKEKLMPNTNVKSDKNTHPTPTTPQPVRQRRTILESGDKSPSNANNVSGQEQSRSRRKGAFDEDQSVCSSPLYGSAGRRRKVMSQASSTESEGHSSQGEGTPKRSSRIKHHAEYHIMFTGVGCTGADEVAIRKLGGKVVQEPDDCTILITDKMRRTFKFLCIMGQGKPIVSPDWIKQSQMSGHFLDPWNFIIKDKEAEKKYNFQLQKSLKVASVKKLLDGYSVFVTPSVKPPPIEMKGIVENCGGQFLTKDPSPGKWTEKSFIISAVEDKKLCSKFKKASVPIVSAEILLTGILQQKLNINDYVLKL